MQNFELNGLCDLPGLGQIEDRTGLQPICRCSDGCFEKGRGGVNAILSTGDGKVEFIAFENKTLAYVKSAMGYAAYYPVHPVSFMKPVKAVLMDLDGTTVRSEAYWIGIIQEVCRDLLGKPAFELEDADIPYVSGHSVSEHLTYCIGKYCPERSVEQAVSLHWGR